MHPLGSIDISVAAVGGFQRPFAFVFFPSIFHCLSIIPTFNTTTSILKHFIHANVLSLLLAFTCQTRAIFYHGYLLPYLPNRLKSLPVPVHPCARASLPLGAEGHKERGWPSPKTPNLSQICTLWASTCGFRQRGREGGGGGARREGEREKFGSIT